MLIQFKMAKKLPYKNWQIDQKTNIHKQALYTGDGIGLPLILSHPFDISLVLELSKSKTDLTFIILPVIKGFKIFNC